MKLRFNLILIFVVLLAFRACGQYFQFSQSNFTTQRISPAIPATSDYAGMSYIYRNQGTGGNLVINSHLLSASFPLITATSGKRWGGVGLTMMDDRSSPVYELQEAAFSFGVNMALNHSQSLAIAIKTLYQQQTIDPSGLSSGIEYLSDRFRSATDYSTDFKSHTKAISLSSGLHWQSVNPEGLRLGYFSLAVFDFYNPAQTEGSTHYLTPTWVGAGNFRAFKNGNLSMFPELIYTKGSITDLWNVGFITRCDVKLSSLSNPYYVNVLTKYLSSGSGIVAVQYHNDNFSLGASYEMLLKNDNLSNIGAFEIGLEIRRLVRPEFKNKTFRKKLNSIRHQRMIKETSGSSSSSSLPGKSTPERLLNTERQLTFSEKLLAKRDSVLALKIKSSKAIEVDHAILKLNFGFNSTKMDSATMRYLDDLAKVISADPRFKLKLTGHTDNIGTPSVNYQLSLHRSNAVKAYLVQKGVVAANIKTEGRGMAQPLNENKTEQQRAKNRRVEVRIYIAD
jgi:type IX secretion system PorP/SprF family membrane protein